MDSSKKFICIHGHFYQPPRENAWLEVVEKQNSAAPFHDWNDRINFECYAPNAAARILNDEKAIVDIFNNYAHISFNFGATLLSWLKTEDPETYQKILAADQLSQQHFNGHGSAMAQVHSHLIMPLANRPDKVTQVKWGISDFKYRFGRHPEGMWLAETAVDTETLEVLAENDIRFTVLAPRQAQAVRKIGEDQWMELIPGSVDPRQAYRCLLPSGKSIALFFYDGNISQGVAFEGLLNNGRAFAGRLLSAFSDNDAPQLVHIATDGESYGHHHRYGEMALASCLHFIESSEIARVTNYGEFLELCPPEYEVKIHENSSWSCVHGVERWRSNCGCHTGGRAGWHQAWRAPLREALNWLRDELIPVYEKKASKYLKDAWEARNDYIHVVLSRSEKNIQAFVERHAKKALSKEESTDLMRLMEMQRHAILMFTSCGWFFDEISGIETNQILQYANRAIYYAHQVADVDLHEQFVQLLEKAPSNVYQNGAQSYNKYVAPSRVDLTRVGMHYAVSSVFENHNEQDDLFNYHTDNEVFHRLSAGIQKLALGRTTVKSKTTLSEKHFSFAVLYLGQHNIFGHISTDMPLEKFNEMATETLKAFKNTNLGGVIEKIQTSFGGSTFNIDHLFKDEKQKILHQIAKNSFLQAENAFRDIYNDNYQLMTGIQLSGIPVPDFYLDAAEFVVNQDLRKCFENGDLNLRELKRLMSEFQHWNIKLSDEAGFRLIVSERIFKEIQGMSFENTSIETLKNLVTILNALHKLGFQLDLWKSQNRYASLLIQSIHAASSLKLDEEWKKTFYHLGTALKIYVPAFETANSLP